MEKMVADDNFEMTALGNNGNVVELGRRLPSEKKNQGKRTSSHSSLLRYPGGKSRLAKLICGRLISLLPSTETYFEPFFGSGAVCLTLLESYGLFARKTFISDADPCIAALWTSVIQHPKELKQLVMGFKPNVEAFYAFKAELRGVKNLPDDWQSELELGFRKLALHRISYSGLGEMSGSPLGGKDQGVDGEIGSRWNPERLCHEIDRASDLLAPKAVEGVCHHMDFRTAIAQAKPDSLIYLDPPYFAQGPALYRHCFSMEDHVDLAELLKSSPGKWLLSYDDCEQVGSWYSWAGIERLPVKNTLTQMRKDGMALAKAQNELLITPAATVLAMPTEGVA